MIEHISAFIAKHYEIMGLLALAFVVTMREKLPPPLDKVPIFSWCYDWLHDALKTFVSFRSPSAPQKQEPPKP